MLTLIFAIGIVFLLLSCYFKNLRIDFSNDSNKYKSKNDLKSKMAQASYNNRDFEELTGGIAGLILLISIAGLILFSVNYIGIITIEDKIKLYETENIKIEEQISTITENYKNWESDTYEKFENESPTVLISLFPELKSNELVNKQITIYVENNQKIKQLKEKRLDYKIYGWWLSFNI